jgi:hypothetical protein
MMYVGEITEVQQGFEPWLTVEHHFLVFSFATHLPARVKRQK